MWSLSKGKHKVIETASENEPVAMTSMSYILGHLHMKVSDFFAYRLSLGRLVTRAKSQLIEIHDVWVECELVELQK